VQVSRKGQIRSGWRKLDGSQRGRVHRGLTEQHAVRAKRSSKKRQTKPIEISHKSLALKELTSDGFGLLYAKQTQFRVVEAVTLEGWRCQEPARRQLLPQPRYAQILTTDSAQQHPIEDPGGSETNHGIHRHTQKREFGSALPFRVLPGGNSRP